MPKCSRHQVFCFECICGKHIETETRTLECPSCHRLLVIEWGKQAAEPELTTEAKGREASILLTEYSLDGILGVFLGITWEKRSTAAVILDLQAQVSQLQETIKALPASLNPPPGATKRQKKGG